MENISYSQLVGAVVVILALCAAYSTIMSAVKTRREEKKLKDAPIVEITKVLEQHGKALAADKVRLERLEADASVNQCENKLMMKMLLALTRHAIDGNNISDLKSMRDEVQNYLVSK